MKTELTQAVGNLMAVGFIFWLFMMVLVVIWIFSLIDVIRSDFKNQNNKTIWMLLLIFLAPLGTILYQLIGKGQKQEYVSCMIEDRPVSNSDKNGGKWM